MGRFLASQSHRDLETLGDRHSDTERSAQSQELKPGPDFLRPDTVGGRTASSHSVCGLVPTSFPPCFLSLLHSHSSLLLEWPGVGLIGSERSPPGCDVNSGMEDTQGKGTGWGYGGREGISESQLLAKNWRIELVLQKQELSLDPGQAQSAASVKGLGLTMWRKLGDEKWKRKWELWVSPSRGHSLTYRERRRRRQT